MKSPMTWTDAYEIAFHAMGHDIEPGRPGRRGRPRRKVHRADEDPLAAHCLAEWILSKAHGTRDLDQVTVAGSGIGPMRPLEKLLPRIRKIVEREHEAN